MEEWYSAPRGPPCPRGCGSRSHSISLTLHGSTPGGRGVGGSHVKPSPAGILCALPCASATVAFFRESGREVLVESSSRETRAPRRLGHAAQVEDGCLLWLQFLPIQWATCAVGPRAWLPFPAPEMERARVSRVLRREEPARTLPCRVSSLHLPLSGLLCSCVL